MGRKTKQQPAKPPFEFNEQALADAGAALTTRATQLAPIDKKFGGIVEYHKERVIAEAAFFVNQGSESFFEAGRRLILLKEHEQHGEFLKALENIGLDARAARKLMTVAARFADTKALQALPRSKMLELAVLDDEDLDELDKGGSVAGLTFDEVDRMGVRELRAQLRQERKKHAEDNEASEKLLERKDKKINELARKPFVPWDERIVGLVDELHTCSLASSECLTRVYQVAEACALAKLENDDDMHQQHELAQRIINDVNLLVERVAAIQGFTYDHFGKYVEGGTPVLTEVQEPRGKRKG